jgi:hypothetical protein
MRTMGACVKVCTPSIESKNRFQPHLSISQTNDEHVSFSLDGFFRFPKENCLVCYHTWLAFWYHTSYTPILVTWCRPSI